jgi:pimeloyl-ACP methyl ester carboxylesterase
VIQTSDGVALSGQYYAASSKEAPLLVLVHHFRADRSEWAPLVERLVRAQNRYSIVTFDLRGHGGSVKDSDGGRLDWAHIAPTDVPRFVDDVRAAIELGSTPPAKPRSVVIVGSSLGAALAVQAAREVPSVAALALVSPGEGIHGYGLLRRFAALERLPVFIAHAQGDTVSAEPAGALARIAAGTGQTASYPGAAHGARGIARTQEKLWDDLERFLMDVYDERPLARQASTPERGEPRPASAPAGNQKR